MGSTRTIEDCGKGDEGCERSAVVILKGVFNEKRVDLIIKLEHDKIRQTRPTRSPFIVKQL